MRKLVTLGLLAGCLAMAGVPRAMAQPPDAQIIALDECDPTTFNDPAAAGPGFCQNVALGASTVFANLISEAVAGTPDPNWAFAPTQVTIKKGGSITVVDQGGEPHTFTEVKQFGGGFLPPLNGGQDPVPECAAGFGSIAVAKTRILQGSTINVLGLSKGKHLFQCCIHPWMRTEVDVK